VAAAATAVLVVALVADDAAALRNAPRPDAPAQATLWRGDWLEVRGESAGFLKVYDHRHERPGYIRPQLVRVHRVAEENAHELGAVVKFLRDATGNESLGIGYAALALKAAPAGADTSVMLASIGGMAERLAKRASARRADGRDKTLAAHLEVAQSYGVNFTVADGDTSRTCYDGEVWRQILALPNAGAEERTHAALFLAAQGSCRPALTSPAEERERNDRRLQALGSIDFAVARAVPGSLMGRVHLRRAEAFAWRAFDEGRRGNADAAARAEGTAVNELALCDRGVLAVEDLDLYQEVAVRVAASRWATEPSSLMGTLGGSPSPPATGSGKRSLPTPTRAQGGKGGVAVSLLPRAPGETCVRVETATRVLGERCTYGVVWPGALRWAPSGTAATIAVQPLAAWTELWLMRRMGDGSWSFDALAPATTEPDVGYAESAGFSPDGNRVLVVREARVGGRMTRKFQVLAASTLAVERWAASAEKLSAFKRWSTPSWRAGTLVLR
jgi:hypothetical protein